MPKAEIITKQILAAAAARGQTAQEAADQFGVWRSSVTAAEQRHGIHLRRLRGTGSRRVIDLDKILDETLLRALRRHSERRGIPITMILKMAVLEYLVKAGERPYRETRLEEEGPADAGEEGEEEDA